MKITVSPYDSDWLAQFKRLKQELSCILAGFDPVIEHIGSTSVPGLAAKPIIDIQIGVRSTSDFPGVVDKMVANGYIYYQVFETGMPNRRLFVRLHGDHHLLFPAVFSTPENIPHEEINRYRWAHVHVWELDTPDWHRHLAFRDYLILHPTFKDEYAAIKMELSKHEWEHGMAYNDAKNQFVKKVEAEAVAFWQRSM